MKIRILLLLLILLGAAERWHTRAQNSAPAIAILQTATHPALDLVSRHFKQKLIPLSTPLFSANQKIRWIEYNGMGQMSALQTMAQRLHQERNLKLIFAIGTPAAQVIALSEKKIPIVYAAVTDPSILGKEALNSNICGVSDGVEAKSQMDTLLSLWPQTKKIAIIYNPSESNSEQAVKALCQEINLRHLEYVLCAAMSANEMPAVAQMAARSGDLVFAPADNLVAMTLSLIARACEKANVSLMVGYSVIPSEGIDASFGIDYARLGDMAAEISYRILSEQTSAAKIGHRYLDPSLQIHSNSSSNAKESVNGTP